MSMQPSFRTLISFLNRGNSNGVSSLRIGIGLILFEIIGGTLGFILIEGYTLIEGFYMTIITISTVGYTEVRPLSATGELFTSGLILINIGVFAYVIYVFTYHIFEGNFFHGIHLKMIQKKVDSLNDHIILCGFGRYGMEIADHFDKHKMPFVVIALNAPDVEEKLASGREIMYIEGDATNDEVLIQAGIKRAEYIVSALPDDTDNLFTVLSARQLNPNIKIISRANLHRSENKLLLAGADHVIMPEQIGGFYMATLVNKPGAVEFFSFITNEYESDIGFEEISYEDLPPACRDKSLRDLDIRQITGVNIIGYRLADGKYQVNPSPETLLSEHTSFIALGNLSQLKALKEYLQSFK
jgi:voltage-gated potassium channel